MGRNALVLMACTAALALFAGSASAAEVSGAITDSKTKTANPAQDIRGASIAYDQAGRIKAVVNTGAPAFDPNVAGFRFVLGTASVKRGFCDGAGDVTIYTDKPNDTPFGAAYVGARRARSVDGSVAGNLLLVDTLTGEFPETSGPIPALAGKSFNCGVVVSFGPRTRGKRKIYVDNDETPVFPLTAAPGPPPSCSIATRSRRGRLRATCVNVSGPVTVRIYRKGKLHRTRNTTVAPGGAVTASTRGLRRKRVYGVAVWQGPLMLGVDTARIR